MDLALAAKAEIDKCGSTLTLNDHGFIISAPSGRARQALVRRWLRRTCRVPVLDPYTTCAPRGRIASEGENYHFISREDFEKKAQNGEFLEYAEVLGTITGRAQVFRTRPAGERGLDLVIDIDVQGARQLKCKTWKR
ncbi:MAG: hypothetical protein U0Q18_29660 [Bryobacteraceae bacterium]